MRKWTLPMMEAEINAARAKEGSVPASGGEEMTRVGAGGSVGVAQEDPRESLDTCRAWTASLFL